MRSQARSLLILTVVGSTSLLASLEACSSSHSSTPAPIEAGASSGTSGASSGTSGASSGTSGASSGTSGASSGTSGSSGDAGFDAADAHDAADGAVACLNDTLVGAAPACPGAGACTAQCATINANFKKGVAAETVKNLTAGICGGNTSNATTTTALAKSCSDATAKAFCDALVAGGCTTANGFPNFAAQCLVTANGLTGTGTGAAATLGRAALYDCINNNATHDCTTCQDLVKGSP